jgi:hypothetical protein
MNKSHSHKFANNKWSFVLLPLIRRRRRRRFSPNITDLLQLQELKQTRMMMMTQLAKKQKRWWVV